MMSNDIPAHEQTITHHYAIAYPEHEPRDQDPWAQDFREWKRRRKASFTNWCDFAHEHRDGDTSECDNEHPLEAHHKHIEFALKNGLLVPENFALFEAAFPGITLDQVGEWIDSDANLELLCVAHHRGHGGKHIASVSDFEAELFIRNLIS